MMNGYIFCFVPQHAVRDILKRDLNSGQSCLVVIINEELYQKTKNLQDQPVPDFLKTGFTYIQHGIYLANQNAEATESALCRNRLLKMPDLANELFPPAPSVSVTHTDFMGNIKLNPADALNIVRMYHEVFKKTDIISPVCSVRQQTHSGCLGLTSDDTCKVILQCQEMKENLGEILEVVVMEIRNKRKQQLAKSMIEYLENKI